MLKKSLKRVILCAQTFSCYMLLCMRNGRFNFPGLAISIMLFTDMRLIQRIFFVYRLFLFLYDRYLVLRLFSFTANRKFCQRHDSVYNHCQATIRLRFPPKIFCVVSIGRCVKLRIHKDHSPSEQPLKLSNATMYHQSRFLIP